MFRRRRRGLGFFPGLIVGAALVFGASAIFGPGLCGGTQGLQQEEPGWGAGVTEIVLQGQSQVENVAAQTETGLQEGLSHFTEVLAQLADNSAED